MAHLGNLIEEPGVNDQVLASIAHELKTPLTLISGIASQLQDPDFDAGKYPHYVERIQYSSDRLLNLIDGILKGYELKQHVLELQLEPLSPLIIMEEVAHELEPHARKQAQLIQVKSRRSQPLVLADKACLHAIIFNLLDNAIKYTKPEHTIELEARLKRDYAQLAVKDYGVGVKRSDVKRIFEQFGKSQRPIPRWAQSTGLGLYIAKQLTEAMRGSLELAKRRDGSSFLVNLQLSKQLSLFE